MAESSRLRRLAAELAVIVLGVMIALAADSWRQGIEEQRLERRYVERLTDEVHRAMVAVESHRESRVVIAAAAQKVAASMDGEAPPLSDDALLQNFIRATQIGFSEQEFSVVTYQELIASGNLALLREERVREAVLEFYRRLDLLVERINELQTAVPINDRIARLTGYFPYVFDSDCVRNEIYACAQSRTLTEGDRSRLLRHLREDEQVILELKHVHADLILSDEVFAGTISFGEELIAELERVR